MRFKYIYHNCYIALIRQGRFLQSCRLKHTPHIDILYMEEERKGTSQKQGHQVKIQYQQLRKKPRLDRFLRKKTYCPVHNMQRLIYRCAEEGCKQPYICLNAQCIQSHFHKDTLKMTKIDIAAFEEKFQRVQQSINKSEKLFSQAFKIKTFVDSLKDNVTALFENMNGMGKIYGDLKADLDTALTCAYITKIEDTLKIQSRITAAIQKIRAKINLIPQENLQKTPPPMQELDVDVESAQEKNSFDFFMRNQISNFLEANIGAYDQRTLSTIIDIKLDQNQYDFTQFHNNLSGKSNLIFIFAAENMVVGSYFSLPYPSHERAIKDAASFIFAARKQAQSVKILKYLANEDSENHLQVSEGILVAQGYLPSENKGLKIINGAQDILNLSLPSASFPAENINEDGIFERIKLEKILVLQVKPTTDQ